MNIDVTVNGGTTINGVNTEPNDAAIHGLDIKEQGPQGPPGPPGPIGEVFIYNQATPASEWTIFHDLGYFPNVTVVDLEGHVFYGSVTYTDDATVVVEFSAPYRGSAYLS